MTQMTICPPKVSLFLCQDVEQSLGVNCLTGLYMPAFLPSTQLVHTTISQQKDMRRGNGVTSEPGLLRNRRGFLILSIFWWQETEDSEALRDSGKMKEPGFPSHSMEGSPPPTPPPSRFLFE